MATIGEMQRRLPRELIPKFRLARRGTPWRSDRLRRLRARVAPPIVACALGWAFGAFPSIAAAQSWLPLVRESRPHVVADVSFEAESIREIDSGVFEIRLRYDPVAWSCVRRDPEGGCDVSPDFLLTSKRITVIRIRCSDMSYEEVAIWLGDAQGNWRQMWLMDFRHPPGWRYDIQPSTAVAAARDLLCASIQR